MYTPKERERERGWRDVAIYTNIDIGGFSQIVCLFAAVSVGCLLQDTWHSADTVPFVHTYTLPKSHVYMYIYI